MFDQVCLIYIKSQSGRIKELHDCLGKLAIFDGADILVNSDVACLMAYSKN